MPRSGITAGPEELAVLETAFHEAWHRVGPIGGPLEGAHREWLARLILGLRQSGHADDIAPIAVEQFLATAPMVEWAAAHAPKTICTDRAA
jgi:hypothetical protein